MPQLTVSSFLAPPQTLRVQALCSLTFRAGENEIQENEIHSGVDGVL
jgi:hypothetical protein